MAYVMTYTSLLEDLRSYLERGFTAESDPLVYRQLPRLIAMAETRIAQELKIQGFIRSVQTPLVPNSPVYPKPDRWRDTISMTVNGFPIQTRSYEFLRAYWPDETETGTPQYYADYDYSHWLIAPTPATAATLEILYYEKLAALDETNETNWLTEYAPQLLLYGSLMEAAPYLKNDPRVQVWQSAYDRAAQTLNGQDLLKILDRTATRSEA